MPADDTKRPYLPRIASYNATNGREVSSFAPLGGHREAIEGEDVSGWAPMSRGVRGGNSPSWDAIDKARCQGGNIKNRPQG
jgi:hypothetical protein